MSKSDTYGVERDVRIMKGSSSKHSARLEGQYPGLIPSFEVSAEPKREIFRPKPSTVRRVKDPRLYIDLDAKDIGDDNFVETFLDVIGIDPRDADFDVVSTIELCLRALAKAKFKNLASLKIGDEVVYEHPEKEWDLREVLENIREIASSDATIEEASGTVFKGEEDGLEARIKVRKKHTRFSHDIYLDIDGEMEEEYFNRIINYLEEHLEIEKLIER